MPTTRPPDDNALPEGAGVIVLGPLAGLIVWFLIALVAIATRTPGAA